MPPLRRSRRLSRQSPTQVSEDGWETPGDLIFDPALSPVSSPNTVPATIAIPSSPVSDDSSPATISHTRRRSAGHVPRPPNAFICFRSAVWAKHKEMLGKVDHRKLSEQVGSIWRNLPEESKEPFRSQARHEKASHYERHPDWKYAPKTRKDRSAPRRPTKRKIANVPRVRAAKATPAILPIDTSTQPIVAHPPPSSTQVKRGPSEPTPFLFSTNPKRITEQRPSPPIKKEESYTPEDGTFLATFDSYVSTEDIPPLDLNEVDYELSLGPTHILPVKSCLYDQDDLTGAPDFLSSPSTIYYTPPEGSPYEFDAYSMLPDPNTLGAFSDPWSGNSPIAPIKACLSEPPLSPKSFPYGTDSPVIHAPVPSSLIDISLMDYITI